MSKVLDQVEALVLPIMEQLGFELVDTAFIKNEKDHILQIFIDKEGGIDIEECVLASEKISEKLDEVDLFSQSYFLEVSSPGAERPLKSEKDFKNAIGEYIHVTSYENIEGQKIWEGTLTDYDGEKLTIVGLNKTRKVTWVIPKKSVASARLAVKI